MKPYTAFDLLAHCRKDGLEDKTAIIDGVRRITFGELLALALGHGRLLRESGLEKGDRVAIYLRRSVEAVIGFFATYVAGGVPVFINEVLRPKQVNYILEHSGASVLITDTRQLLNVPEPAIPRDRIRNLDEVRPSARECSPVSMIGADLALIIYTSGSTGFPKGVMVSHDNLVSGAEIVADYLNLSQTDIVISLLPFSFDYGLNQLLTMLLVGGTLVIQRSPAPPDICRTLERERVTGMAGVPALWLQLCDRYSPFLKTSFPYLRYLTNSGGQVPEGIVKLLRKTHPHVEMYLMYGLTEAFRSTYLPPDQVDVRPTSIGKAIPNVEILIVNEAGKLCGVDEVGELVHRGATVTMGYWQDPESTAKVFRPYPLNGAERGGFERSVFSGDLVKRDADGYLYFVGRRDQLIKSKGFRVSPEEIERWVYASDLVAGVVAFAVSSNDGDSEIVLAVIPKEPETFREERLHQFCKSEMPSYMRPHVIWRIERIPQTSSGKPDRVAVKQTYVDTVTRS